MITTILKSLIQYIIVRFFYNNDYSFTDLLRHASRLAGNSRKTIKDIVKHSVLITYIQSYLNIVSDKPPGVGIASGKSVNLSVSNQKLLGMNVARGQLPKVNVADSFVATMEEYIKGHSVADEYPGEEFNCDSSSSFNGFQWRNNIYI